jgi:hypothetical protein
MENKTTNYTKTDQQRKKKSKKANWYKIGFLWRTDKNGKKVLSVIALQ